MSFAIHSGDGVRFGAGLADYPFKYPAPGYLKALRDALWSIEIGMGGRVDWDASFGARQGSVSLMCAQAVHGSQFGLKRRRVA